MIGLLGMIVGCGDGQGPARYEVSGEVKFDGKPVPYGEVLFTPDSAKGNSGAQGIAIIQDGKYSTAGTRAPGVAGGAMVVHVTGLSDPNGKLLCEHEFSVDLPKADTVHNIDIPTPAAKKKPGTPEI